MQRTTSVILGDELQRLVERWLSSGRYGNVSEIVRDALRRLEADEARTAAQWAYAESLPLEEPDADDLEALARIEVARARGDLDEAHTLEEWDEIERREGSS